MKYIFHIRRKKSIWKPFRTKTTEIFQKTFKNESSIAFVYKLNYPFYKEKIKKR